MIKKKISNGSFQQIIEEEFVKVMNLGNFESVYLFSDEGLPIIELCGRGVITGDDASQMVLQTKGILETLNEEDTQPGVKEVLFYMEDRRKVDIRYFRALGQQVALALVVPPGKSYRSHANRMIRFLSRIEADV
ncbi:MAG: hypothetical protein GXO76_12225 [Calditrichaeota bacterium]|nr:hypothetical protein [Calditrichota bacterium]